MPEIGGATTVAAALEHNAYERDTSRGVAHQPRASLYGGASATALAVDTLADAPSGHEQTCAATNGEARARSRPDSVRRTRSVSAC